MNFIHLPRTGGSSICRIFGLKDSHAPWQQKWDNNPDFRKDEFVFSVIRNPWDLAVSVFEKFCHGRNGNFQDWVLKRNFAVPHGFRVSPIDQIDMLPPDWDQLAYLGLFEDMPATWRRLVKAGAKVCRVPMVRHAAAQRERRAYPSYFEGEAGADCILKVWERNQEFIERSGYEFDPNAEVVPIYQPTVRELEAMRS